MRKNNGNIKIANKRNRKQNKRKIRKSKHNEFLYKTLLKYGKLDLKYRLQPGEKYINSILNDKSESEKEETTNVQ